MLVTACWRIVIALWGIICHGMVQAGPTAHATLMNKGWPRNPLTLLVDAGVRQDAFWYARIALHGYTYSTRHLSSIVFYPLFPALVKGVSLVTGSVYTAGTLISIVSLFLAVYCLHLWLDDRGLSTASTRTMLLMLCFPFGFFWASMYTESLFLALALATFVFFERGRWELSAVCAFAAVLCRPTGLIIAPCLALMMLTFQSRERVPAALVPLASWLNKYQSSPAANRTHASSYDGRGWLPVASGPIAFLMFSSYQWIAFGTPFASVRAEGVAPFSRSLSQALSDLMLRRLGFPPWFLLFMLAFGLVFLAAVPWVYKRFGAAYALFAALAVLFPMTSGLTSLERYVMIDFPVFAAVGAASSRRIPFVLMMLGFYASLGFMTLFVAGYTII